MQLISSLSVLESDQLTQIPSSFNYSLRRSSSNQTVSYSEECSSYIFQINNSNEINRKLCQKRCYQFIYYHLSYFSNTMKEYLLLDNQNISEANITSNKLRYKTNASCFEIFSFGWIYSFLKYGNQKGNKITDDKFEQLASEETSQAVFNTFQNNWNHQKINNHDNPLGKALRETFIRRFLYAAFFDFFGYQLTIFAPIAIYFTASFLLSEDHPIGVAIFWFLFIPFFRLLRSLSDAHGTYKMAILGSDVSNCVSLAMVKKALNYSVLCNKSFKMGQISNLMQVDCFRLQVFPKNFAGVIFVSYVLIFGIIFMAVVIGVSFLAGVGVLFLASVINMLISKKTSKHSVQIASKADDRMKVTNEVFNNIKFIKVNAWQEYFYDKLIQKREEQLKWYKLKYLWESFAQYSMWITPKYTLAATFGTYVATGGVLTPPIVFSIMSLYGYIQFYLQFLPAHLGTVVTCFQSIKRIQNFLLAQEVDRSCIKFNSLQTQSEYSVQVENGNFYWDKNSRQYGGLIDETLNLENINIKVRKGQIVGIIGDIGCGKSSLMYSLLGEMKFKKSMKPTVKINGTMSLVTQKPWIVNDTVKNNILFGKSYNPKKYQQCIHYACLKRDFELFTHGDQTMIGQKGATLSGGQKARISFARSLYSDSDILLLDDLLSAVDVHVGKTLMTDSLLKYSSKKTRILITHALHYLKYVDKVIIMEDGKIVQQGTYAQIKETQKFQQIHQSMMKEDSHKRKKSGQILELEAEKEEVSEEDLIDAQILSEASDITNKSKNSAVSKLKLQKIRSQKYSKKISYRQISSKIQQQTRQTKQQQKVETSLMMSQEVDAQDVGFKLYASYIRYNRGYAYMSLVLLAKIVWMFFNAFSNLWMSAWTQGVANQTNSNQYYLGIYLLIGFAYGTTAFFRAILIAFASPKTSKTIHESMISNLLFAPLNEFFDRIPTGRIFNRLSKDLNSVDATLPSLFNSMTVFIFFLFANTIVICIATPFYIFLPLIIFYVTCCIFLKKFYSRPNKQAARIQAISKSPVVSCFSQILSGVSTIRSYQVEDNFFTKNCDKINDNKRPIIARKASDVWFTIRITILSFMVMVPMLIYVFFFSYSDQSDIKAASNGALVLNLTIALDEIMYFLLSTLGAFEGELVSLERCEKFMNIEPEKGYASYLRNRNELKIASKERRKTKSGWPQHGKISFINFKCKYRPDLQLVLRGLTVTFQAGEKIGVVGRTGSGKSTIMMCLLRVLEASQGRIMIDDKDISQLSLDDLRSKITIILQDPCLFSGSLKENLDPLHEYADSDLIKALQLCGMQQQWLKREISENGENIAVGQRQLISICRSILKPTRIVLVDEATANIDVKTESMLYKAMNEGFKHSTVITVAHRLNTVINSDKILVLEGGMLKQYDDPKILLKNPNSFFAQLYYESQKESTM